MGRRGNGEGSIYKRVDGRWAGYVTLEGGRRKFYYGDTRREVSDQLKKALRDQQQGLLVASPRQTVAQYLDSWLRDSVKPTVRIKTLESYARTVRVHISPALGKHLLNKLTAQHLQAYYARKLDDGLAPGTVNRHHAIIHRALAQAVRLGLLGRSPADLVDAPRPLRKEMRALSPEESVHLLEVARGERLCALYWLAVTTGMRQSELLGLTWPDVDFASAEVRVHQQLVWTPKVGFSFSEPKTAKGRRAIAIPALAVEALRAHRLAQLEERLAAGSLWEDHDLVFPNEVGRPMDRGNLVRRSFHPLLEKAGLPRIRFHDLRHTAATMLLCLGENPKVVQERLGHATVGMTLDVYSHVLPNLQRQAAAKLDALLGNTLGAGSAEPAHLRPTAEE